MSDYKIVPDSLRDREEVRQGRAPESPLSKDLLAGKTVFIPGKGKGFGSAYKLASNRGLKAHTKRTTINGERGTLVWFEERAESEVR